MYLQKEKKVVVVSNPVLHVITATFVDHLQSGVNKLKNEIKQKIKNFFFPLLTRIIIFKDLV